MWIEVGTAIMLGDSTYYYYHTAIGINDLTVPMESITVYPNPSSTTIIIGLSHTTAIKNTFLTIYNLKGQELITSQITGPKTQIDISNLLSGVYFVKVVGEKGLQVGKFVKQ